MGNDEIGKCKYCGAAVMWFKNENGKKIPVDAAKVPVFPDGDGKGEKFYYEEKVRTASGLVNMHTAGRIDPGWTAESELAHRQHTITCPKWAGIRKARDEAERAAAVPVPASRKRKPQPQPARPEEESMQMSLFPVTANDSLKWFM